MRTLQLDEMSEDEHGTQRMYEKKCKCTPCINAHIAYYKKIGKQIKGKREYIRTDVAIQKYKSSELARKMLHKEIDSRKVFIYAVEKGYLPQTALKEMDLGQFRNWVRTTPTFSYETT
jgi:hypothetical protein